MGSLDLVCVRFVCGNVWGVSGTGDVNKDVMYRIFSECVVCGVSQRDPLKMAVRNDKKARVENRSAGEGILEA